MTFAKTKAPIIETRKTDDFITFLYMLENVVSKFSSRLKVFKQNVILHKFN